MSVNLTHFAESIFSFYWFFSQFFSSTFFHIKPLLQPVWVHSEGRVGPFALRDLIGESSVSNENEPTSCCACTAGSQQSFRPGQWPKSLSAHRENARWIHRLQYQYQSVFKYAPYHEYFNWINPRIHEKTKQNYKSYIFKLFLCFVNCTRLKTSDCATLCPFQIASHA